MNALLDNEYNRAWSRIGQSIPRPKAILSISAHWYIPATSVTAMLQPRTIHDFGGFPRDLYRVQYSAPGDIDLARQVQELLAPVNVNLDEQWGLDHGTWSVLRHVFPEANVPVLQLSMDETQPPQYHYELAKRLAVLREEGILIMGSGNVVHNLHAYAWGRLSIEPYEWGVRFEKQLRNFLAEGNDAPIVDYESLGGDAILSAPTPDHFLPLIYVIACRKPGDVVTFPVEGFDGGSVSMLSVLLG